MTVDGGTLDPSAPEVIDGGGPVVVPGGQLPLMPSSCWPVDTRCISDWDAYEVEPDLEADPPVVGVPVYSEAQKELALSLAGQTMRMLTGYRVGGCPIVVRPCRVTCGAQTWLGLGPGWSPVNMGGTWLNIGCGHRSGCSCAEVSEVRLWGPASLVAEVLVDGEVLPPTAYRLDAGGLLVRTDGLQWPLCQNLSLAPTEPGTWQVTYLPAAQVDGAGAAAAGVLAAEYLKACTDQACGLPSGATQVARNGVTITITPDVFPEGRTGIATVDAYVRRWNPHSLAAPSTVWSPDVQRPRTTLT